MAKPGLQLSSPFTLVQASGVSSMSTVSLASKKGHFSTLDELTGCIRASMLVPGLAGPLASVPRRQRWPASWTTDSEAPPSETDSVSQALESYSASDDNTTELLVDAMVFEPLPYR